MKLSLLNEADMSRRDFLGFLGKAGAAVVGAPLGKLDLSKLGKLATSTPYRVITSMSGTHYGRGMPPSLSHCVLRLFQSVSAIRNVVGGDNVKVYADEDWGFGAKVSEAKLKKIARESGTTIDDDYFWHDHFGIDISEPDESQWMAKQLSNMDDDPIGQWVAEYAGWDMPSLIQTPSDVWELEHLGLRKHVPNEVRGKLSDAEENVRDRVEHEAQDSVEEIKPGYAHLEREAGYEKESMFDPQSSRYASALGPFESRLREVLTFPRPIV